MLASRVNSGRNADGRFVTVSDHYARSNLVDAIQQGIVALGKTTNTVTIADLAPVDEFHIGGRNATAELAARLNLAPGDHVLDVGCGLGGAARYVAEQHRCRVTGIDLTQDYVNAGQIICQWVGLADRVSLHQGSALSIPFPAETFTAAYMLHAGMNIADKNMLCSEVARVLSPGALFAIYDVMRTDAGELSYPVPWATTADMDAAAEPESYRTALKAAGFDLISERSRKDYALTYFAGQKTPNSAAPPPLGLHTLMGERRKAQVQNMVANISGGLIAPYEMVVRKLG
jgi:ubiquinone/menaquinone biosynthesis C-methylase UbiE